MVLNTGTTPSKWTGTLDLPESKTSTSATATDRTEIGISVQEVADTEEEDFALEEEEVRTDSTEAAGTSHTEEKEEATEVQNQGMRNQATRLEDTRTDTRRRNTLHITTTTIHLHHHLRTDMREEAVTTVTATHEETLTEACHQMYHQDHHRNTIGRTMATIMDTRPTAMPRLHKTIQRQDRHPIEATETPDTVTIPVESTHQKTGTMQTEGTTPHHLRKQTTTMPQESRIHTTEDNLWIRD